MAGTQARVQHRDPDGRPYDELVPEPVADLAVDRRLDGAAAQVRALDERARRAAGAAGVVRSLLVTESLSSEQMNRLATGRPVAAGSAVDRRMRRFEQACRDGRRAGVIDLGHLLRIHGRLVERGGALRTGPAWVGSRGSPADAVFVGPPVAQLDGLVADLLVFLARHDLCPIVQTAVAYAQLELIHPFRDGNGRMGRWLIQVMLHRRRVAGLLVPPVGVYFAANPNRFMTAHRAYREGDLDAWCTYFGAALEACAQSSAALIG
jgi:Fic family protein